MFAIGWKQLWANVIAHHCKNVKRITICDVHFEKSNIITEDVTTLPDGRKCRIKRNRSSLNHNAVPKYFLGVPLNVKSQEKKWVTTIFLTKVILQKFTKMLKIFRYPLHFVVPLKKIVHLSSFVGQEILYQNKKLDKLLLVQKIL